MEYIWRRLLIGCDGIPDFEVARLKRRYGVSSGTPSWWGFPHGRRTSELLVFLWVPEREKDRELV